MTAMMLVLLLAATTVAQDAAAPAEPDATAETPTRRPRTGEVIGLVDAKRRLGKDMPTGRGVVAGHVEGSIRAYLPNAASPKFEGLTLIARSGPSRPIQHATRTAGMIYGPRGMAPGIADVHVFAANHWLGAGYLRLGTSASPVAQDPVRVFNHSWLVPGSQDAVAILRRLDYQIDTQDVVMCVGVNNGYGTPIPPALSSAYNVIAVGTYQNDKGSSTGYTRVEVAGRCKPDLVGHRLKTSFTTPQVTSTVAMLLERADAMAAQSADAESSNEGKAESSVAAPHPAHRAEVIKAILMAGATKPTRWVPEPGKPLDEFTGAGVLHVDRSLRIQASGPVEPGATDLRMGWSFLTLEPEASAEFAVTHGDAEAPVSIVVVWHRRVAGPTPPTEGEGRSAWDDTPRLADFALELIRTDDDGQASVVAQSDNTIDNVEHLYFPSLEPGDYRMRVTRKADGYAEAWDAAVAWRWGE